MRSFISMKLKIANFKSIESFKDLKLNNYYKCLERVVIRPIVLYQECLLAILKVWMHKSVNLILNYHSPAEILKILKIIISK